MWLLKLIGLLLVMLGFTMVFTLNSWALSTEEVKRNLETIEMTLDHFTDDMQWVPYINDYGKVQFLPIHPDILFQYIMLDKVNGMLIYLKHTKEIDENATKAAI